ncbi:MAG: cysteine desulfurase NifS [Candidatus Zixiibacteriota bacterium]|nr:MAG: cysteine desulfurase NifS [candidate division Zixibacteria bacterium]
MRTVYLDHNATTPVHPGVLDAMLPYFSQVFGNASSLHQSGREAKAALENARQSIAEVLGCRASEIIFTSGGTESDNFAIKGTAFANRKKGKHIITSSIEHHAVEISCRFLEKEGFEVTFLPVDSCGFVDPDDLKKAIRPNTTLVTIMYANNETGVIQDIEALGSVTREAGVYFHTDAVQATGKIPYKIDDIGCDMLSISAHKLYGPKGVGLLYIKSGTNIIPWNEGGGHEKGMRAGTENVAGIIGLAEAIKIAHKDIAARTVKLNKITRKFYESIKARIPDIQFNGHYEKRVPNTINISFKAIEGEAIVLSLDMKGIMVSTGSACTSGATDPSHVLRAMGVSREMAQGSIRFSFGRSNSIEDVDYVVDILAKEVNRLRSISPLYADSSG